jgi:hypothetical protein
MCPLCIGTATLLVSSGTSAGGLAALLLRRRAGKNGSLAHPRTDRRSVFAELQAAFQNAVKRRTTTGKLDRT